MYGQLESPPERPGRPLSGHGTALARLDAHPVPRVLLGAQPWCAASGWYRITHCGSPEAAECSPGSEVRGEEVGTGLQNGSSRQYYRWLEDPMYRTCGATESWASFMLLIQHHESRFR